MAEEISNFNKSWKSLKYSFTHEEWKICLSFFCDMIESTDEITKGEWRVGISSDNIKLNIANYISCMILPGELFIALLYDDINSDLKTKFNELNKEENLNYKRGKKKISTNIRISAKLFNEYLQDGDLANNIKLLALKFCERVADMKLRYSHLHQQEIIEIIAKELGRRLPKNKETKDAERSLFVLPKVQEAERFSFREFLNGTEFQEVCEEWTALIKQEDFNIIEYIELNNFTQIYENKDETDKVIRMFYVTYYFSKYEKLQKKDILKWIFKPLGILLIQSFKEKKFDLCKVVGNLIFGNVRNFEGIIKNKDAFLEYERGEVIEFLQLIYLYYYYWVFSDAHILDRSVTDETENLLQEKNKLFVIGKIYFKNEKYKEAYECFEMGGRMFLTEEYSDYDELEEPWSWKISQEFIENNQNAYSFWKEQIQRIELKVKDSKFIELFHITNELISEYEFSLRQNDSRYSGLEWCENLYFLIFTLFVNRRFEELISLLTMLSSLVKPIELWLLIKILQAYGFEHPEKMEKYLLEWGFESSEEQYSDGVTAVYFAAERTNLKVLENLEKKLEESRKKTVELESENKILEKKLSKHVQQFTHTLSNTIFPQTIYKVVENLKQNPELRKEVLMLTDAYQAEREIQLQAALLQRHGNQQDAEQYRMLIRQDRLHQEDTVPSVGIMDILNYASSRVIARFLNENYSKLNQIRRNLLNELKTDLQELRHDFEEQVLLEKNQEALEWVNQKLDWNIECSVMSEDWKRVKLKKERYAETVIYGHFAEILFNALKYGNHEAKPFLKIEFIEKPKDPIDLLGITFRNTISTQDRSNLGTGNGLEGIAEDLRLLNESSESLCIVKDNENFQVTMFYPKDLILLKERKIFHVPSLGEIK